MSFAGHGVTLQTARLTLRPMEAADYETALPYHLDPEFFRMMDGESPDQPVTVDWLRSIGADLAEQGYLFALVDKSSARTIGEACLQWMNLPRAQIEGERVMRMPIGVWDKTLWGHGYGGEVVRCLMAYGFDTLGIDRLCPVNIASHNHRSQALWRSCGLRVARALEDGKTLDFEITRQEYQRRRV